MPDPRDSHASEIDRVRAALWAMNAADVHWRGCHQCGADLHGDVWHCAEYTRLRAHADDLRCAALSTRAHLAPPAEDARAPPG